MCELNLIFIFHKNKYKGDKSRNDRLRIFNLNAHNQRQSIFVEQASLDKTNALKSHLILLLLRRRLPSVFFCLNKNVNVLYPHQYQRHVRS